VFALAVVVRVCFAPSTSGRLINANGKAHVPEIDCSQSNVTLSPDLLLRIDGTFRHIKKDQAQMTCEKLVKDVQVEKMSFTYVFGVSAFQRLEKIKL
jgi:hypothetical protein